MENEKLIEKRFYTEARATTLRVLIIKIHVKKSRRQSKVS